MSLCRIINCVVEDPLDFIAKRQIRVEQGVSEIVSQIIDDVRSRGDAALLENARKFDAPDLQDLQVSKGELKKAEVSPEHLDAIRTSIVRVMRFHEAQLGTITQGWNHQDGAWFWYEPARTGEHDTGYEGQRMLPLSSAGAYVPGGKANYPSSVIMNVIPAKVAGVQNIVVTTPANKDGEISPAVLVALREVGVSATFKIGGAAAVAALALGTESVPKVDRVVGPGNVFVNEAKRQLWGQVGLDNFAGPSEVCVVADDDADPDLAASDWLIQIEHSEDNAGFLIVFSEEKLIQIIKSAERLLAEAPRNESMRKALKNFGCAFVVADVAQAGEISDALAPEHLTLMMKAPETALRLFRNAGAISLGSYTPQSAGDFVSGPSHTLPTSTGARFGNPINVLDFLKISSVSNLSSTDLEELRPTIEAFGDMEGFPVHGGGPALRFTKDKSVK